MNTKNISAELARITGHEVSQANRMIECLAETLSGICANMDTVAIPGFGTFQPVKNDEAIEIDPITYKRMLMPPNISVSFRPSVLLKKQIKR